MRIPQAPVGWWALVVALLLVSSPVRAEEPPPGYPPCDRTPTEGEVAAAKGAFQAGTGSFNEADYERAITYWEDAYRRDCTAHPLLLNLARAYELNGQKKHAVLALETFLQRSPDSQQAPQIQRRIDKLNAQIRSGEQQANSPPPQPAPPPVAPATGPAETSESLPPAEVDVQTGKRPVLPLIVAGAGGVLAIVGSVVFFVAKSDVDDFESTCGDRSCTAEEVLGASAAASLPEQQRDAAVADFVDDGNAARTRMNVGGAVALVGAGAFAGGLVWYFLQPREGEEDYASGDSDRRPPRLGPSVAPGFAGLQLSGRF